jgi:lipoate-protein ligase A
MHLLDLTLTTPAANVALDEALLDAAEAGEIGLPVLRLWESPTPFVVLGRSSRVAFEVDMAGCQAKGITIIRRASGGASVVAGSGCLMYALVMPYAEREHLRELDKLHCDVLSQVRHALAPLALDIEHVGTCDLAINGRKFSGNAVRCKRDHFLYHGTLLYAFDLMFIETVLRQPLRQPDYRASRRHADFLMNLDISAQTLRSALASAFGASTRLTNWPEIRTQRLVTNRYSNEAWNFER